MHNHIFTSTKNWKFTTEDRLAEQRFTIIQEQTVKELPESFYSVRTLTHLPMIRDTRLYKLMKTIPKGCLHHIHYPCCDDSQFYKEHIITDSRIYLSEDLSSFRIGTKEEANQNGWISMKEGMSKFGEEKWLEIVVSLTCFTQKQLRTAKYQQRQMWQLFEKKILTPFNLIYEKIIYQKYLRHILLKFKANGYQRVQVRVALTPLKYYDQEGKLQGVLDYAGVIELVDRVVKEVSNGSPEEFFGWIEAGFKFRTDEDNQKNFRFMCESNWKLFAGLDFVNEEDKFEGLERYDPIIDKVLADYPHLSHIKKVYHAGQTTCHRTSNIDVAVKAGSIRIGHGLNILQRVQFLPHCRHVCFQKNPLSNLILGYKKDLREASAPILLGLGYPVSISPDDPGKFGIEDTTQDYFIVSVAYNWNLRHLKLIAYHSINHSLCEQSTKTRLIQSFQKDWDSWIKSFLKEQNIAYSATEEIVEESSMFSSNLHWSFTAQEDVALSKLQSQEELALQGVTEDKYSHGLTGLWQHVCQQNIYRSIESMPKGVLHSCHLHYCHDRAFYTCLLKEKPIFWISRNSHQIRSDCQDNLPIHQLVLYSQFIQDQKINDSASHLYSLTSLSFQQLQTIQQQEQFWAQLNRKKKNFLAMLRNKHIFGLYVYYVLKKLSNHGYERVEFRVSPLELVENSSSSSFSLSEYFETIEKAADRIKKQYPYFSIGLIITGCKSSSLEDIQHMFDEVCKINSRLLIGFDFQQEDKEDSYPSLSVYDQLLERVLINHEDCKAVKLYQAGLTKNHRNDNVRIAIEAGAKRIANCSNILQNSQILPRCQHVCLELSPIFQHVSKASGRDDFRLSVGSVLLGLGLPVSVGCSYAGLLGCENTFTDLLLMVLSSVWSLKHIKLTFLHSLQHAAAPQGQKIKMRQAFLKKWNQWISSYINQ